MRRILLTLTLIAIICAFGSTLFAQTERRTPPPTSPTSPTAPDAPKPLIYEFKEGELQSLTGGSCCDPATPTPPTRPNIEPPRNRPEGRPGGFGTGRQGGRESGVLRRMDLTPEQAQKINTIHNNYLKAIIDKRAAIDKLEIDKKAAEEAGNTTQVKRLIDDISKLQADIEKAKVDLDENIKKELTAEQRERYNGGL